MVDRSDMPVLDAQRVERDRRLRRLVIIGAALILLGALVPIQNGRFGFELPRSHFDTATGAPLCGIVAAIPACLAAAALLLCLTQRAKNAALLILALVAVAFLSGGFVPLFEELGPMHHMRYRGYFTWNALPMVPSNAALIAAGLTMAYVADRERARAPASLIVRIVGGAAALSALLGLLLTGMHGVTGVLDVLLLEQPVGLGGNATWLWLARLACVVLLAWTAMAFVNAWREEPLAPVSRILHFGFIGLAVVLPVVALVLMSEKDRGTWIAIDNLTQVYGGMLILGAALAHVLGSARAERLDQVFE
ncbi:MAG: hypothetical protein QNJ98_02915 [Planctomycetota bacterium]|nr:hypothetical protein [Planctomycetota bacterium]